MHLVLKLAAAISVFHLLVSSVNGAVIGQFGILQDTSNGGNNPVTGIPWRVGDTYRLAFLSSTSINGSSDNIDTYNSHVRDLAFLANLGRDWNAIISTPTVSARANTGTTTGSGASIFLTDGLNMVAANNAALWDGAINNAIINNESGGLEANGAKVFTGTITDGTASGLPMGNGGNGTIGSAGNEAKWINSGNSKFTNTYQIYALSGELTVVPEPSSASLVMLGVLLLFRRKQQAL